MEYFADTGMDRQRDEFADAIGDPRRGQGYGAKRALECGRRVGTRAPSSRATSSSRPTPSPERRPALVVRGSSHCG